MIGMALATAIYAAPTWTRHAALVSEHPALRAAITCGTPVPSVYPCYRFTTKLRTYGDLLAACLDRVTTPLHAEHPDMGVNVAIDGSDLPDYQRYLSKNGPERERYSDPDASWGHRSAVSTRKAAGSTGTRSTLPCAPPTGLPVAWNVRTAGEHETTFALPLIDAARECGFGLSVAIADKGYDNEPFHNGCMDRGIAPVTSLARDACRQARRPPCAVVRARRVDVRRGRLQAPRDQVALPDR